MNSSRNIRVIIAAASCGALLLCATNIVSAWTGPTASPPGNNVAAPLNVGSTAQVKSGNIGVNGLAVFGNTLLQGSSYLNWGAAAGSTGYGLRDNGGSLEYKNSGGSWTALSSLGSGTLSGSGTAGYVARWTSGTGLSNSSFTDNGTSATFSGGPYTNDWFRVNGNNGIYWQTWGGGWYMTDSTWLRSYNSKSVYTAAQMRADGGFCIGSSCITTWPSSVTLPYPVASGQTWHWAGESGQPTWLWGSNDGNNFYVWNPSNFNVSSVDGYTFNQWVTTSAAPTFAGLNSNGNIYVNGSYNSLVLNNANPSTGGTQLYLQNWQGLFVVDNSQGNGSYTGNRFTLDPSGNGVFQGTVTAGAFLYGSDERLKKDIQPVATSTALADVLAIQPVTYQWIDQSRGTGIQLGFIAQNVQSVVPEIVHEDASTTLLSVDYARLTPLLVGSVQELDQRIAAQQAQIDAQQQEIQQLEASVQALENARQ